MMKRRRQPESAPTEDPPHSASADPLTPPLAAAAERSGLHRSVSRATRRVEEIIDVAEQVAEDIRVEAEQAAERYLAERRQEADRILAERRRLVAELDESVSVRAERLREDLTTMVAELERKIDTIRSAAEPPTAGPSLAAPEVRNAGPDQTAAASSGPRPAPGRGPVHGPRAQGASSEEALLRATQLEVMGKDRPEIAAALEAEFGLADAAAMVESVLGPET
jgi:hypothetical protein